MPTTPMLGATDRRAVLSPHKDPKSRRRGARAAEREQLRREAARYIRAARRSQP